MMMWMFIAILIWISLQDMYSNEIPDAAVLAAIGIRIFALVFYEGLSRNGLLAIVLDGLVISLPLLFIVLTAERLLHTELIGGGDIKLLFVTGIYLGWERNLWTLFLACLIGSIIGLLIRYSSKKEEMYFPFGPVIALAAIISMHIL